MICIFATSQVSERQCDDRGATRSHNLGCDSSQSFQMSGEFSRRSILGIIIVRKDHARIRHFRDLPDMRRVSSHVSDELALFPKGVTRR